ncbi:asparagine synthetase A [Streptomyces mirabilis]|uniref:asparagine synthetase A n=1 Tax=Streptomyces mirabilis TaxID=68239 RepID=UPI0036751F6D
MTGTYQPSKIWVETENYHHEVLRNPWYRLIADLQNSITELTVDFWRTRDARTVYLPVTTGSISSPMGLGSDSLPVQVDLFGQKTYLADSMQFMLELGCRITGKDTYYIMPSFRGEDIDARHLSQFFHSEAEIRGGLSDVTRVVEEYLVHLAGGVLERHGAELRAAGRGLADIETLANGGKFRTLTFEEAVKVLDGQGIHSEAGEPGWRTLTHAGERLLMEKLGEFTWVTHFDHLSVPFYQAFPGGDRSKAANADLLFGIGEIVGAGERHETADELVEALDLHRVGLEPYEWYADIRRTEPLRTAGFGMGVERFLMWLLDHDDIRDLQLVPRENGKNIVP